MERDRPAEQGSLALFLSLADGDSERLLNWTQTRTEIKIGSFSSGWTEYRERKEEWPFHYRRLTCPGGTRRRIRSRITFPFLYSLTSHRPVDSTSKPNLWAHDHSGWLFVITVIIRFLLMKTWNARRLSRAVARVKQHCLPPPVECFHHRLQSMGVESIVLWRTLLSHFPQVKSRSLLVVRLKETISVRRLLITRILTARTEFQSLSPW